MPSKNKLPAHGPSDHGGEPEPLVPPVDAITKMELFLEKHWRMVVAVLVAFVTLIVIYFYMKQKKADAMTQANNAFTAAVTRADFEEVVKAHPGTIAAGSALYEIANRQLTSEADLPGAQASLQKFISDYPDHKLRENALLGLGGISEKQGDLDKASGYFQEVIDAGDKSSLVPLATICKTEILVAKGQLEEAKEIYESFGVNHVGSPFVDKAIERLAAVEAKIERKAAPPAPEEPAPEEPAPEEPAAEEPTSPASGAAPTTTPATTQPAGGAHR